MEFQLNASTWFRLCNRHDSLNLISAVPHEMRTISFLFLLLYYFLFGGHITSMTLEISFHSLNLTLRACNLILYCFQSLSRSSSFLNHFQSIKRGRVSLSISKKVIEFFLWNNLDDFPVSLECDYRKNKKRRNFPFFSQWISCVVADRMPSIIEFLTHSRCGRRADCDAGNVEMKRLYEHE